MTGPFNTGVQPCAAFREKMWTPLGNRHECYGPYGPGRDREPRCGRAVSFCEACNTDHHAGGWDTCGSKPLSAEAKGGGPPTPPGAHRG